jgi:membrane-associated phospholipid phosphatase
MSNRLSYSRRVVLASAFVLAGAGAAIAQPDSSRSEVVQTTDAAGVLQPGWTRSAPTSLLEMRPFLETETSRPMSGSLGPKPKPSVWEDLFAGSARDIKRLPSKQTLSWLAVGALAAAGTHTADGRVSKSLSGAATLREPLEPGAVVGSTPFQLGASVAVYAVARWANHPHLTEVSADLVRAQLLAEGLTIGLKQSIRRRRPEGSGFAFPSGHTTVSFASATVLQRHYGWKLGLPAYGVASYVALSRVQMRRHYLSDVAFGAALGIVTGRTVTLGHRQMFALTPSISQAGAGLQLTFVGKK